MNIYTFEEHIHRYAVWTAARAVNRDFAKTEVIRSAIEKSKMLREYLNNPVPDASAYQFWHSKCAKQLIKAFKSSGITCSYGRAAKIIAIYLKTALILPRRGRGPECKAIFPPIDSILLKAFVSDEDITKEISKEDMDYLKKVAWTKIEDEDYSKLRKIISKYADYDWTLEKYWKVN